MEAATGTFFSYVFKGYKKSSWFNKMEKTVFGECNLICNHGNCNPWYCWKIVTWNTKLQLSVIKQKAFVFIPNCQINVGMCKGYGIFWIYILPGKLRWQHPAAIHSRRRQDGFWTGWSWLTRPGWPAWRKRTLGEAWAAWLSLSAQCWSTSKTHSVTGATHHVENRTESR